LTPKENYDTIVLHNAVIALWPLCSIYMLNIAQCKTVCKMQIRKVTTHPSVSKYATKRKAVMILNGNGKGCHVRQDCPKELCQA